MYPILVTAHQLSTIKKWKVGFSNKSESVYQELLIVTMNIKLIINLKVKRKRGTFTTTPVTRKILNK